MAKQKLTDSKIEEIRSKYSTGQFNLVKLAKEYSVSQGTIRKVVQGITKPKPTVVERFMSKVDSSGGEDACWIWTGTKDRYGYGRFRLRDKKEKAHRVSYELFKRKVPKGQLVRHKCNNPACVNPSHLRSGTHGKNIQDMIESGRNYKGCRKSKLNEMQMLEVKFCADLGKAQHAIAKIMGLSSIRNYLKKDPFELQRQWLEKERQDRQQNASNNNNSKEVAQ
jgi:hypothetical protein